MEEKTALDLDAIEARANAATPGPWIERDNRDEGKGVSTVDLRCPEKCGSVCSRCRGDDIACLGTDGSYQDNTFIAHARTDVPALIAEVRRLREEADVLHGRLSRLAENAKRAANERDAADDLAHLRGEACVRAREEARLWRALATAQREVMAELVRLSMPLA